MALYNSHPTTSSTMTPVGEPLRNTATNPTSSDKINTPPISRAIHLTTSSQFGPLGAPADHAERALCVYSYDTAVIRGLRARFPPTTVSKGHQGLRAAWGSRYGSGPSSTATLAGQRHEVSLGPTQHFVRRSSVSFLSGPVTHTVQHGRQLCLRGEFAIDMFQDRDIILVDTKMPNEPRELARLLKVLAVGTRVQIVQLLKGRALCVGALSTRLDGTLAS